MELSFNKLLKAIIKSWYIVVTLTVLTAFFGLIFSSALIDKKYDSTSKIYVTIAKTEGTGTISMTNQQAAKHAAEALLGNSFCSGVSKALNNQISADSIRGGLSVSIRDEAMPYVEIRFTYTDANTAQDVLEKITELIDAELETIPLEKERISTTVIDPPSLPTSPSSPNLKLLLILFSAIGLAAGCLIACVISLRSGRFASLKEIEKFSNLPILGDIPRYDKDRSAGKEVK